MAKRILKCAGTVLQPGKVMSVNSQDDFPIFPNDLAFAHLPLEAVPSTSGSTSDPLPANIILERAKAAKQYLEEEAANSTPSKCRTKQDPVKSRKKQKDE